MAISSGDSAAASTFSPQPCGNQKADRRTNRKRILGKDARGSQSLHLRRIKMNSWERERLEEVGNVFDSSSMLRMDRSCKHRQHWGICFIILCKNDIYLLNTVNKWEGKLRRSSVTWNEAQSSCSLWVLTRMDPASSFSLFYPCRDGTCKESLGKMWMHHLIFFFLSMMYNNNKIIKQQMWILTKIKEYCCSGLS